MARVYHGAVLTLFHRGNQGVKTRTPPPPGVDSAGVRHDGTWKVVGIVNVAMSGLQLRVPSKGVDISFVVPPIRKLAPEVQQVKVVDMPRITVQFVLKVSP
jgi:hypothetical protein